MVRLSVRHPGLVQLSFSPTISSGLETLAGASPTARAAVADGYPPSPMNESEAPLSEQLSELGAQLAWVREYL